ncbi:hypothetical protein SEMRO_40_G024980.1 [Seminavis robusta]|uniref:Uncharacterized protein n=1 Tax=Seminavis robusta TaxID=568900 RepID=A0A9N8DD46_9STRA|nr:hypothetical protein SEMRO_40_G024980.1 [Seminavis robusta]|eukprot:Sro40_g024980.1 n/a (131) ;mRNA; r:154052-154517
MPGGTRYTIPLPDQEHRPVPRANVDFEDVKKDIDTLNEDTDLFYNQAERKAKQNRDLTGCYKHAKHFPVVNIRYNGKRQTLGHSYWAQVSSLPGRLFSTSRMQSETKQTWNQRKSSKQQAQRPILWWYME